MPSSVEKVPISFLTLFFLIFLLQTNMHAKQN